jgi:hypothetical protein
MSLCEFDHKKTARIGGRLKGTLSVEGVPRKLR